VATAKTFLKGNDGDGDASFNKKTVFQPTVPLRNLAVANSSLLMARLDEKLLTINQASYVKNLARWREGGKAATWLLETTRAPGERKPRTAREFLENLLRGAPGARYLLQFMVKQSMLEPLFLSRTKRTLSVKSMPSPFLCCTSLQTTRKTHVQG